MHSRNRAALAMVNLLGIGRGSTGAEPAMHDNASVAHDCNVMLISQRQDHYQLHGAALTHTNPQISDTKGRQWEI